MRAVAAAAMATVIVALVALGVTLDRIVPTRVGTPGDAAVEAAAVAGAWVCAAGDTDQDSTLEVFAVAPPNDGGQPSSLAAAAFAESRVVDRSTGQVFPNSAAVIEVPEDLADLGMIVRWWDVPAAVSREWRVDVEGAPSGIVAGPCQAGTSERWIVPGVATAGGAQSELVLANPFTTASSVAIDLTTPDGTLSPKRLENVVVPARAVVRIPLNEHAPEQADLGAVVRTRSGRVIVEATQTFDAAIGGIEGRSLVLAAPEPAENWTVPFVATGESTTSWVWVTNPSDRDAALLLSLHTPSGGVVPEGLEEVTVPAGSTRRIELVGLLEDPSSHAAVTVVSDNAVPVVVSAATAYDADREARTGVTVSLGSSGLDPTWTVAPGRTKGRELRVDLANPSAEPATVTVGIWTGAGLVRPESLEDVVVPAGGSRAVDVTTHLDDVAPDGAVALVVTASDGEVVVGLRAWDERGRRDAVAFVGVPSSRFRTGVGALPVRFSPTLPEQVGTPLGPRTVADPLLEELEEDVDLDLPPGPSPSP